MTNELRRYPAIIATAVALFILAVMLVKSRSENRAVERNRQELVRLLERLAAAERNHHEETGRFAGTPTDLGVTNSDPGIILTMELSGSDGWSAVARHTALTVPPDRCGIFLGAQSASPHRAVVRTGVVSCW